MRIPKWSPSAERLVKHDSESVDVDALVDLDLSSQDLGGHVGWGSTQLAGRSEAIEAKYLGGAEVHEAWFSAFVPNDVGRLQIAMKDAMFVNGPESIAKSVDQCVGLRDRDGATQETCRQGFALDVLGDQEDSSILVDAELEQSHDPRMIQRLEYGAFPAKPPAHRIIGEVLCSKHLDRGFGAVELVDRFEHVSHRSSRDLCNQQVARREYRSKSDGSGIVHASARNIPLFANSPNSRRLSPSMSLPNLHRALTKLYGEPLPSIRVVKLRGDASTRSYYRVYLEGSTGSLPESAIVMRLPDDALGSDEGGTQPSTHRLPFVEVAELLRSRGLPVPAIFVEDLENGILLLEDLGDTTFEQGLGRVPSSEWGDLYARAIDLLADLHERCGDLPATSIVSKRRFDRDLLQWELEHFREWGLEGLWGPLDGRQSETLSRAFSNIVLEIEAMPYGFVHRDYQSKNLMLGPGGALTLIDFQDALLGPRAYDLVALLCDSYVPIGLELQESMIERYAALRRIDPSILRTEFWLVALHRKLKDAGRFIFIDRVRKNPDFLQWYPQSMVYVGRAAVQAPGFEAVADVLRRKIPGFPDEVQKPHSSAE